MILFYFKKILGLTGRDLTNMIIEGAPSCKRQIILMTICG
jgi:hypothetical protein